MADMLSRACIRKDETLKSMEINILRDTVSLGWAENNRQIHPQITQYWKFIFDEILLKGEK